MDNVTELKQPQPFSVLGPERGGNVIVLNGRILPFLHGHDLGDRVQIIVDNRFAADFDKVTATQVVHLLAEAMAVAAGYSNSGAKSKDRFFAAPCHMIDALPDA